MNTSGDQKRGHRDMSPGQVAPHVRHKTGDLDAFDFLQPPDIASRFPPHDQKSGLGHGLANERENLQCKKPYGVFIGKVAHVTAEYNRWPRFYRPVQTALEKFCVDAV